MNKTDLDAIKDLTNQLLLSFELPLTILPFRAQIMPPKAVIGNLVWALRYLQRLCGVNDVPATPLLRQMLSAAGRTGEFATITACDAIVYLLPDVEKMWLDM